jgi:branched-chain amino acid transport system permease protein
VLSWLTTHQFSIDVALIEVLLAMSVFVVLNAGVFSLASVGFMAIGGYGTGVLTTKSGLPIAVGILAGTAMGAAAGFGVGLLVARLRGIYLALATFALSQAIIEVISILGITNGVQGIIAIPTFYTTWVTLAILVALAIVLQLLHRSYLGRALRSVRLDDVVARGMGIPIQRYRLAAMVASGALAGCAGALNAHEVGVITPDQYSFNLLVTTLTYVLVGGITYWAGPLVAALVLGLAQQLLSGVNTDWVTGGYGVLLVVMMITLPGGLGDARLKRIWPALRQIEQVLHRRRSDPTPRIDMERGA